MKPSSFDLTWQNIDFPSQGLKEICFEVLIFICFDGERNFDARMSGNVKATKKKSMETKMLSMRAASQSITLTLLAFVLSGCND